jgi:putative nucleotidyltransferase with HDIG domain
VSFITESLAIDIGNNTYISLGFAIGIGCVLIFDPAIAGLILFLGTILHFELEEDQVKHLFNTDFFKRLFNSCAYGIVGFASGTVYRIEDPYTKLFGEFMGFSVFNVTVAMVTYVVMCILLYAVLFSIIQKRPVWKTALDYSWIITKFIAVAPLGIVIALAQKHYGSFSIFLFFGPLLLARYSFIQFLQMKEHYMKTINSFTRALDAKDQYTNGHSERVSEYAVALAKRLRMNDKKIQELKTAALLHDIGKIGVSDTILNKPDRLSLPEMYEIKRHPEIGARIIEEIIFLKHTAQIIRHHHERYDGSGYPDAIAEDAIPLEAKIISIVDAYDAMTSNRAYRTALTKVQSLSIIESEAGRQFDPIIAKAFIDMMRETEQDAN